jgi:hypothetical protein
MWKTPECELHDFVKKSVKSIFNFSVKISYTLEQNHPQMRTSMWGKQCQLHHTDKN